MNTTSFLSKDDIRNMLLRYAEYLSYLSLRVLPSSRQFSNSGYIVRSQLCIRSDIRHVRWLSTMNLGMFGVAGYKKILNPVIQLIFVFVMNNLCFQERSAKMLLHNISLFNDVSVRVSIFMGRYIDPVVATTLNSRALGFRLNLGEKMFSVFGICPEGLHA